MTIKDIIYIAVGVVVNVVYPIFIKLINSKKSLYETYMDILTNDLPDIIVYIEENTSTAGKGNFKLNFVLQAVENICNESKIKYNEEYVKAVVEKLIKLLNYGVKNGK